MPRKERFGFDPSNTAPDGHYIVGKGRPPEAGKFRKGDGRKRGRRSKGTKNLATSLQETLEGKVLVNVKGVPKQVSRQDAILMRLADNATTKGQNSAIALILDLQQRLVDPRLAEQDAVPARNPKLKKLSSDELDTLLYLTAKLEDADMSDLDIIGVKPIFREYRHQNIHEAPSDDGA